MIINTTDEIIEDQKNYPPNIEYHIEEVKSMRDEINWRVKTAYTSSIIFISAISVLGGTLFSTDNTFIETVKKDPEVLTQSGIAVLIAISAWVGVQNANHLIEKRIELYCLELLKVIFFESKNVYCSWLGFLYGSDFFKNRVKNFFGKFLNASIGMFMYFLPNVITLILWFYLMFKTPVNKHYILFFFASLFVFVAVGSTILFFFYVVKVNKKFSEFHDKIMLPYFKKHKPEMITVS